MSQKTTSNKASPYNSYYTRLIDAGFHKRFKTYMADSGVLLVFECNSESELTYSNEKAVRIQVEYFMYCTKNNPLSPEKALSVARYYLSVSHQKYGLKELPPAVVEKSSRSLCFKRLPFDYKPYVSHRAPTRFLEFCSRISDADVFQAYVGSLFIDESYRQQYLYMFGDGNDTKGTFFRFLKELFGVTCTSIDEPKGQPDKFWSAKLLNKRVCVIADLQNGDFPTTQTFKMLTGDDSIPVETKYKDGYDTYLTTKFIIGSNYNLELTEKKADKRRALYVTVESYVGRADNNYVDKLLAEAPAIYALCREKYFKMCGDHGPINQVLDDALIQPRDSEDSFNLFIEQYFDKDPDGKIRGEDFEKALRDHMGKNPNNSQKKQFSDELSIRGYHKRRDKKGNYIAGLKRKSNLTILNERRNDWLS